MSRSSATEQKKGAAVDELSDHQNSSQSESSNFESEGEEEPEEKSFPAYHNRTRPRRTRPVEVVDDSWNYSIYIFWCKEKSVAHSL